MNMSHPMMGRGIAVLVLALVTGPAFAGVVSMDLDANDNLTSVVIDRDGTEYTYAQSELTNISLTGLNLDGTQVFQTAGRPFPGGAGANAGDARDALLEDWSPSSGVFHPSSNANAEYDAGQVTNDRDSIAFDFLTPVTNSDGVDVIVVDFGPTNSEFIRVSLTSNADDPNEVTISRSNTNFIDSITIDKYNSSTEINQLAHLRDFAFTSGASESFGLGAFEIDLSLLGVAEGATVSTLYMTDAGDPEVSMIFGLPAVPEPTSLALLAVGSVALWRRR